MPKNNNDMFGVRRLQKPSKEQQDAIEKRNSIFRACFSTPAGKAVLEFLEKKYLNKPVCMLDNVYYGYVREGQNDIIRTIKEYAKEK